MADELAYTKSEAKRIVEEVVSTMATRIRERHILAKQKASGRTAASIRSGVAEEDGAIHGWVDGRQAFYTLEHGRNKGYVPRNFSEIIRQWMRNKGIKAMPIPYVRRPSEKWQPKYTPEQRGEMSLAWAIAMSIKANGTYLAQTGIDYNLKAKPDIYTTPIEEGLKTLSERISALFSTQIDHINKEPWQQH